MDGVGRGIAVGKHQAAGKIVLFPVLHIGGEPIHGIERGGGIGVDVLGLLPELPAQIQADQRRRFLFIPGEPQAAESCALVRQPLREQLDLGGFPAAVRSFQHDQLSHHFFPLIRHHTAVRINFGKHIILPSRLGSFTSR